MRIRNLGAIIVDGIRGPFIAEAFAAKGRIEAVLDLGCGRRPYRNLYGRWADSSIGIDVGASPHGTSGVDVIYDGRRIPFPDGRFDVVLATEVLEHVPDTRAFLEEIHRVLKPGGSIVMTTPFMVPLHEEPNDYYRFTRHALAWRLSEAKFEDIKIEPFGDLIAVLILLSAQLQLKLWSGVARLSRVPVVYSAWNPFVLLFVCIPQWLYLTARRLPAVRKLLRPLEYTPRGYGFTASKGLT